MSNWLTTKQMSERRDIQEAILKNWANLGYITSSRIDDQLFLDDESLDAYLEAHKRLGLEAGYLSKIVEEKKLERDFIISKYDDLLYVLRTQTTCKPLYEIIIRERVEFEERYIGYLSKACYRCSFFILGRQ